jgi:hypothetical protein
VRPAARPFVVYGYASVHDALCAESVLKGAGLAVTPVPSPKELGELCGIALRVDPSDADHAERLLRSAGMEPKVRAEIEDV